MERFAQLRADFSSSLVVFLVALPLCLGIALASGAPLFSGITAGIIGGIIVGIISKSPLSVSGPAAGLAVIVFAAIQQLPTFEAFLLAVFLAGALQIAFGVARLGIVGDFIPTSVIKGMLAAIGLILILKQLPHAVGYDRGYVGDESFWQPDGENTFTTLWNMFGQLSAAATGIALVSVAFLFIWDKWQKKLPAFISFIPAPLVVVIFGVVANGLLATHAPEWSIHGSHLVAVPVISSMTEMMDKLTFPDFSLIGDRDVWRIAITLAIVASIESLLSIEAIDNIDPRKRVTPTNRELLAQGVGNMCSGAVGGLPITSVIVRSSANLNAGAQSKVSTISHGVLLLICVLLIPGILNQIPLAALAAILIHVGYKLTKPAIFLKEWHQGARHIIPYVATIVSILLTDLLVGIGIGLFVGLGFVLWENFAASIAKIRDGNNYLIQVRKDLFFLNKYDLKRKLRLIPQGAEVLIDLRRAGFIDLDNVEIIKDFLVNAPYRNIRVVIKNNKRYTNNPYFKELYDAQA